jgi:hypothetical protein
VHSATWLEISSDSPQRVGGHHHNLVSLEIMTEFPGRNKDSIKELIRLRIPGLCLMKDLADIIDRLLDGLDFACRTWSFFMCWGLAGPQVAWCFLGSGPDRTSRSWAG